MFNRSTSLILLAAVLAAGAGGWLQHRSQLAHTPADVPRVALGQRAPELTLEGLDGREHRLSDYTGHRVLLNFWASWCSPCLEEMPALDTAARQFPQSRVIGVAMDDPRRTRAFLSRHPVAYPVLIGETNHPSTSLRLGDRDEVLPYSVLLDAQGRILARRRGPLDAATLQRWLAPAATP